MLCFWIMKSLKGKKFLIVICKWGFNNNEGRKTTWLVCTFYDTNWGFSPQLPGTFNSHSSPRILVVYREIFLGILLLLKDYFHQKRMSKSYLMEGLQSHNCPQALLACKFISSTAVWVTKQLCLHNVSLWLCHILKAGQPLIFFYVRVT